MVSGEEPVVKFTPWFVNPDDWLLVTGKDHPKGGTLLMSDKEPEASDG